MFRHLRKKEIDAFLGADMSFLEDMNDTGGDSVETLSTASDASSHSSQSVESIPEKVAKPVVELPVVKSLHDNRLMSIYLSLSELFDKQYYVAMQIPLADLFQTQSLPADSRWQAHRVSCVICSRQNSEPLLIIQLDESTETESETYKIINDLTKNSQIPVLRLGRDKDYSVVDLKTILSVHLDTECGEKACPKCKDKMTLRLVTKGQNAGKTFWVCSRYPECKGVVKFGTL